MQRVWVSNGWGILPLLLQMWLLTLALLAALPALRPMAAQAAEALRAKLA